MILVAAAELDNLAVIRRFIRESTTALNLTPSQIDDLELAVDELVTNIVRHGYRGQPGKIEIEVKRNTDAVEICLRDQAPPFDPTLLPPANITAPLEERKVGGLGVYLARRLVDTCVHHQTREGGNELTLTKKINVPIAPTQEIPYANDD